MRWWVLALLACASCDRLLGLDHVDPPLDGSDPSKDTGRVNGTYVQRWYEIAADSSTATPAQRDYPAAALGGSVTLADGSTRTIAITDGAFSFTTPTQGDPYALHLLGQNGERTWYLNAAAPRLVERLTYPPTRELAPAGTSLVLNVTQRHPEGANTQEELLTLGTWTRHKITSPTSVDIDCSTTDANGVQVGILVPHDTAYYTSTSLSADAMYYRIAYSAKVADVTTRPAMMNVVPLLPLAAQPVSLDRCARILAHGDEETTREEAAIPSPLTAYSGHSWYVNADPAFDFALISGLPLAYYGTTGGSVDAMYGNPYGLASIDFELASYALNAEGAVSASQVAVPAAPTCGTQVEIQAGQVELPTNVALGGTAILTNSQLVPVPHAGNIAVTWDPSPDGHADFYFVLVERLLDSNQAVSVEQIVTPDHHVTISAQDFVVADMYQIQIVSSLGYPNAPRGDFDAVGATMGTASYTTPPFRVTSP